MAEKEKTPVPEIIDNVEALEALKGKTGTLIK